MGADNHWRLPVIGQMQSSLQYQAITFESDFFKNEFISGHDRVLSFFITLG
jgi:hypothetical protein